MIVSILGEKNTGKSQFLNYFANRFSSLNKSIYFLDLDLGQPIFK